MGQYGSYLGSVFQWVCTCFISIQFSSGMLFHVLALLGFSFLVGMLFHVLALLGFSFPVGMLFHVLALLGFSFLVVCYSMYLLY